MKQQTMGQLILTNGVRWAMTEYGMTIDQVTELVEAEGKKVCITCTEIRAPEQIDANDLCGKCQECEYCEE